MRALALLLPLALIACNAAQPNTAYEDDRIAVIFETLSSDIMQGRAAGREGSQEAQRYLKAQMRKLYVFDKTYDVPFTATPRGEGAAPVKAVNLHALIDVDDNDSGPLFVITAHYDHLGQRDGVIYNGADDNASGAAALFAIAQSFKDRPPQHDVLFIWFDAEEMRLQGARHFIEQASFGDRPVFNMNLDMISQNNDNEIYASGSFHTPAIRPLLETVAKGRDITLKFGNDSPDDGANDWTLQSDHGPFHIAGLPFVYFGVVDHEHYHQPTDTFATIPMDFYKRAVDLIVEAAHTLDDNLGALAKPMSPKN